MKSQNKNTQQDSSKILEEIINSQRPHSDRSGLGFDSKLGDKGSGSRKIEDKHKSYVDYLKDSNGQRILSQNHDSKNAWREPTRTSIATSSKDKHKDHNFKHSSKQQSNKRAEPRPRTRYQNLFLGYSYRCHNFGHKAINCRAYQRKEFVLIKKENENAKHYSSRNHNRFETLNKHVECHKCNNFGHTVEECRSKWTTFTKGAGYHYENCTIALQAQDRAKQWCVDSGCSKHMTGDESKFITLNKKK